MYFLLLLRSSPPSLNPCTQNINYKTPLSSLLHSLTPHIQNINYKIPLSEEPPVMLEMEVNTVGGSPDNTQFAFPMNHVW